MSGILSRKVSFDQRTLLKKNLHQLHFCMGFICLFYRTSLLCSITATRTICKFSVNNVGLIFGKTHVDKLLTPVQLFVVAQNICEQLGLIALNKLISEKESRRMRQPPSTKLRYNGVSEEEEKNQLSTKCALSGLKWAEMITELSIINFKAINDAISIFNSALYLVEHCADLILHCDLIEVILIYFPLEKQADPILSGKWSSDPHGILNQIEFSFKKECYCR